MKKIIFACVIIIVCCCFADDTIRTTKFDNYIFQYHLTEDGNAIIGGARVCNNNSGDIPKAAVHPAPKGDFVIPSKLDGHLVVSLGDYAFVCCTNINSVSIPDTVKTIGRGCFAGCSNLTHVTLPVHLESIGDYAFAEAVHLTSFRIPDKVHSIGKDILKKCDSLKYLSIPSSIDFGKYYHNKQSSHSSMGMFSCLGALETVLLAEGITEIDYNMFVGCINLKNINIP